MLSKGDKSLHCKYFDTDNWILTRNESNRWNEVKWRKMDN